MNVLVTAGNTQTPIDKVRCITNVFTGRTGAGIALEAWRRGHRVRLLTSHAGVVRELAAGIPGFPDERWSLGEYRTFDDLSEILEEAVRGGGHDAIVHAAAVADYRAVGIFAPDDATRFDPATGTIRGRFADRAAGKVKSDEPELWLRLTRTPKLVDRFRDPWGFGGVLVKFKLEVDKTDSELLDIAERSRLRSRADAIVANTLEGANDWAYVGPIDGAYRRATRSDLAKVVVDVVEGRQPRNHEPFAK